MSVWMLQVDVGDLTFDVRTDGPDDGPPVLLLHGFPETSLSWSGAYVRSPAWASSGVTADQDSEVSGNPCSRRTGGPSSGPSVRTSKVRSPTSTCSIPTPMHAT